MILVDDREDVLPSPGFRTMNLPYPLGTAPNSKRILTHSLIPFASYKSYQILPLHSYLTISKTILVL